MPCASTEPRSPPGSTSVEASPSGAPLRSRITTASSTMRCSRGLRPVVSTSRTTHAGSPGWVVAEVIAAEDTCRRRGANWQAMRMLHLRLIVPVDQAADVLNFLQGDAAVTNIVVLSGAARQPAGDVVLCDVAREGASAVLEGLREMRVDQTGSIALENVDVSLSEVAREASRAAPGHRSDALVWEEVESRTHEETTLSVTYLAFMVVATMI